MRKSGQELVPLSSRVPFSLGRWRGAGRPHAARGEGQLGDARTDSATPMPTVAEERQEARPPTLPRDWLMPLQ